MSLLTSISKGIPQPLDVTDSPTFSSLTIEGVNVIKRGTASGSLFISGGTASNTGTNMSLSSGSSLNFRFGLDVIGQFDSSKNFVNLRNVILNGSTIGVNAVGALVLHSGTAPSTSPAGAVQAYSNSGTFTVRDGTGQVLSFNQKLSTLDSPTFQGGIVGLTVKGTPSALIDIQEISGSPSYAGVRMLNSSSAARGFMGWDASDDALVISSSQSGTRFLSIDRVNGHIAVKTTSAPAGSVTDGFHFYGDDITPGNKAPHFRTEAGNVIKLYNQAHIIDADGTLADITTKFNTLLSYLENLGLIATS